MAAVDLLKIGTGRATKVDGAADTTTFDGLTLGTASGGTGAAKLTLRPSSGESANQVTLDVQDEGGSTVFSVDREGDTVTNDLSVSGDATITGNLTVNGTTTTVNSTEVLITDNHTIHNAEYTATGAQTGGMVVINHATTTGTAIVSPGFTAASGATDATVEVTSATGITTSSFLLITGSTSNDGLYEVTGVAGTTISVASDGSATARTHDFTTADFTTESEAGTAAPVDIGVLRAGTDGIFEQAQGADHTSFTFADLSTSAASGWTDDGGTVRLDTSTDNVAIGTATALGKLTVDGDTDEIQLVVQGHSTQTNDIAVFETSDGTDVFTIGATQITAAQNIDATNGLDVTTAALTSAAGTTHSGGELLVSGGNAQINDDILLTFGTNDDWSLTYDETTDDALELSGAASAANTAGTDFTVTGSDGGSAGSSSAGGIGGGISFTAGTGGAAVTGASNTAAAGGTIDFTGGTGGAAFASTHDGADGGAVSVSGGTGGVGATGQTAGDGGTLTLSGGTAGAAGGGTQGNGGNLVLNGGDGATDGNVNIGASNTAVINLGNGTDNTAITQTGSGQVTFTGNVDAQAGLDVTGGNFTHASGGTGDIDVAWDFSGGVTNSASEFLISGGNMQFNDGVLLTFGNDDDWQISYDEATDDRLEIIGATSATNTNGTDFGVFGSNGGVAGGAAAGGVGGVVTLSSGSGGAAVTGASNTAAAGGVLALTGGTGGAGFASEHDGANGGALTFNGGTGGAGATGQTGGTGGDVTIAGGVGGAAGGGTQGNGGDLSLNGGDGATDGNVNIGNANTVSIELGNGTNNTTFNFNGTGTVALNSDSQSLTIGASADLTVVHNGTNTLMTSATGDFILDNTNATGATSMQLGTDTSATQFDVLNDSGSVLFKVQGDGTVCFGTQNGATESQSYTTDGTGVTIDDVVYVSGNSIVTVADASAIGTAQAVGIALETKGASVAVLIATQDGMIIEGLTIGGTTPAAGDVVYLSETAGALTVDAPTTAGSAVFQMGILRDTSGGAGSYTMQLQMQFHYVN